MHETQLDSSQARFAVSRSGSVPRKIFYYFVQKDGSLGVGSYFNGSSSAVHKLEKGEGWTVSVSKLKEQAEQFTPQKTSFHKSGTLVAKNKKGERRSDNPDFRSIAFNDIKEAIQLRVVYPTDMDKYPEMQNGEQVNVCEIEFEEPFMCKIFLSSADFDFESWMHGIDANASIFQDIRTLQDQGLNIYTLFRKSNNPFTPSAHAEADTLFE